LKPFVDLIMSSPSASSTRKRTESNEQVQPSLKSLDVKPQTGTGANIVLIGPPGSGKKKSL
jgi:hypothetical protein